MAKMMTKAYCMTKSWEMIRRDLIRLRVNRGRIVDMDTFEAIRDRRTAKLSKRLQRELSVVLRGYMIASS